MRLRDLFLGTALMSLTLITAKAAPPPIFVDEGGLEFAEATNKEVTASTTTRLPRRVAPPLVLKDKVFGAAYYYTLSILATSNACSEFFGGSEAAITVFAQLMNTARKGHYPAAVGLQMSGQTTRVVNARTKKEFRLFEKVSLNTNGPFYRRKFSHAEQLVPGIGSFEPNTKEARVLMLLHELGHAIKGFNGKFLLPDDGNDDQQSRDNSRKVEEVCGDEIRNLRKADNLVNLALEGKGEEDVALNGPAPTTQP